MWKVTVDYKLIAYQGVNVLDYKELSSGKYNTTVVTGTDAAPYAKHSVPISSHLDITPLLQNLTDLKLNFKIDLSVEVLMVHNVMSLFSVTVIQRQGQCKQ